MEAPTSPVMKCNSRSLIPLNRILEIEPTGLGQAGLCSSIGESHHFSDVGACQLSHADGVFLSAGVPARVLLPAHRPRSMAPLVCVFLGGAGRLRSLPLDRVR